MYSCSYDGSLRCGDLQKEVFDEVGITLKLVIKQTGKEAWWLSSRVADS